MRIIILTCLLMGIWLAHSQNPTPPVWPNQFQQSFFEQFSYPVFGKGTTNGMYYYDYTNLRYLITRENGQYDRYCGSVYKFTDTPCNQLVVNSKRYMIFPEKKYCCYCCDSTQGCGVLKPDWLTGASYEGVVSINGFQYQQWDQKGLQDNFYYNTNDARRIMYEIDQQPNDIQTFSVDSFYAGIKDPSVFNFPSYCPDPSKIKTCSIFSTCGAVRSQSE